MSILILMQVLGGIFYLLNKIFLSCAERNEKKHPSKKWGWRTWSWIVYLFGLPAWLVIFIYERNWIAFALEVGGIPAMILGLIIALRGNGQEPRWLNYVAILAIPLGLGYSLYDFQGLTTLNQLVELSLVLGFLVGTYQLARKKTMGYLWYMLMHLSCIWLMYLQSYPWLVLQQIISLGFVIDAYRTKKKS